MNAIWIEIPVADLARAKRFYEAVFEHAPTDVVDDGTRAITVVDGQPTVSLNRTEASARRRTGRCPTSTSTAPSTPPSPGSSSTAAASSNP